MGHPIVVRAMLAGGLVAAVFAACAQGQQLLGAGGGASGAGGGAPDAGPAPGMVGSPCKSTQDCVQGATCTNLGAGSYCTIPCPPPCPGSTYCSIIGGTPICVPDLGQECDKCTLDIDCKLPSDACLTAPLGDSFCARDCTIESDCPEGYACVGRGAYEAVDAGAGDAGNGNGGGAGTGGAGTGGAGTADAGTGGAGMVDAGTPMAPALWCVPGNAASCPCNAQRDGVTNTCAISNAAGTCTGTETCNGSLGTWQGCTAKTPSPQKCDGMDDDCDGLIDEGDPNVLCGGTPPPNASWACTNGSCVLGACNPGWTDFPPGGSASQGCTCPVDMAGATCATAENAGMVTDTGGPITFQGTLSSATEVDVWSFAAVDTLGAGTNPFHVSIAFTQPTQNTEFLMDVERGDPCSDTPSGPATSITSYDWCVNGTGSPTLGEGTCGPTAPVQCTDHSGNYYVRVYRAAGVTATCTPYAITATAAGAACDFTMMCESP